jgi:hypothetical protein
MNTAYKEYQKRGLSVSDAKKKVRDNFYVPDRGDGKKIDGSSFTEKEALQNRAFFTWLYDNKSFMEAGQRNWRTNGGKFHDMFKTQGWIDFLHGNGPAYGDFSGRLGAFVPYRMPLGGGPAPEDYYPGGKKYKVLDQEYEMKEDGSVKKDAHGNPVRNSLYDPTLKRVIDQNTEKDSNGNVTSANEEAQRVADLAADSERFAKMIDQAEDPADIPAKRPEHFEELAYITKQLSEEGVHSVGRDALQAFIDKESQTSAGRYVIQRLSGAAEPHIDAMLGEGYVRSRLSDTPPPSAPPAGSEPEPGPREPSPSPRPAAPAAGAAVGFGGAAGVSASRIASGAGGFGTGNVLRVEHEVEHTGGPSGPVEARFSESTIDKMARRSAKATGTYINQHQNAVGSIHPNSVSTADYEREIHEGHDVTPPSEVSDHSGEDGEGGPS